MEIIILTATNSMEEVIIHYEHELNKIHTGRANPNILNDINIKCYGSMDSLSHNAQIKVADAHQLIIKPHDCSLIKAITKAVTAADLKLQIKTESDVVRLIFPQLTTDVRKSLVKDLTKITEMYKVKIRNIRRNAIQNLKKMDLPENQIKNGELKIQKLTDNKIVQLINIEKNKSNDLMTI